MANENDPVTHGELTALISEQLDPIKKLIEGLAPDGDPEADTGPDDGPDDGPETGKRFTLIEMEEYAERQVKKAQKDLAGKKPKSEPKTSTPTPQDPVVKLDPDPVVEPAPIPEPKKVKLSERFWS